MAGWCTGSRRTSVKLLLVLLLLLSNVSWARGTGDLGIIIERATGSVKVVENSGNTVLGTITGLGDLSHASAVYSRDARYAFVFGRDGGLTKIDVLSKTLVNRTIQSGNSIGGAISQDGKLVAVSNYKPGGVKIFDTETLDLVADIPATYGEGNLLSKVIGLVDAPDQIFVFSLWDAGETWVVDMKDVKNPVITKFRDIGRNPYDALITPDGRYYIAGLFGEDGMALLDLWNLDKGVKRILPGYGKGQKKLPVYKMPHLEGWAIAGNYAFVPAVGLHEVLVINTLDWTEAGRIPVHGQPVFVMARPDGRHVWVNFAVPNNDTIQVIDSQSLKLVKQLQPGKGVLHMEFEPRGEEVWLSVRDKNKIQVYNTTDFSVKAELYADTPSGIFFTSRAHRIGL
ncbi:MAG: protein nirF [Gammaproteobacteria bacterium]|nr:protein nirF [Gammaproteobacteria bacterium]